MKLNLPRKIKKVRKDAGIALLTTLLLLFMMSSLLVGFSLLLISNQKLMGTNNEQVHAFYAAEAGMEQLTAGLGNLFSQTYSPSIAQVDALEATPPVIPGIQFVTGNGTSGYTITPQAVDSFGNPAPTITTINAGAYQGMTAMATEYVMMTNARTPDGREVTLKRTTQTVGIPMFQFGIFSDGDLSFFPGPNFNFGGRTHTNGNLFLAAGATLWMADKVDAYKDVIRQTLSNGHPTSSGYTGTVDITISPGGSNYRALAPSEGSLVGGVGSAGWSGWPNISMGAANYNGNLQNGKGSSAPQYAGAAKQLNLGIVTIGSGATQEIDLLRRSYSGEPSKVTAERYFAQASLRVLISDNTADLMNLPCIDGTTQPFNLAWMATPPTTWSASPNPQLVTLYNNLIANGVTPLPLATSGATGGAAWNSADGYWLPNGYPLITGYIKIEEQVAYGNPCGTWKDVTTEILGYGYVGRNINPVPQSLNGTTLNPQWSGTTTLMQNGQSPAITYVPMTTGATPTPIQMAYQNGPTLTAAAGAAAQPFASLDTAAAPTGTCLDPHPYAVIRLERVRDNPSSVYVNTGAYITGHANNALNNYPVTSTVAEVCGVDPSFGNVGHMLAKLRLPVSNNAPAAPQSGGAWVPQSTDFWPNTLFDTREGTLRDQAMSTTTPAQPTLNGTMSYIELDGKNLANWFGGKIGTITTSGQATKDPAVSPNDFLVYISDRRGNYSKSQSITGGWPPLSYTTAETGEYGWNDIVNSTDTANGCPNVGLDTGEDADGTSVLYTYGASQSYIHGTGITPVTSLAAGQLGIFNGLVATTGAIQKNATCAGTPSYATDGIWPMMLAANAANARENPPLFFRRALKIVNASNLTAVGTCPSTLSCGLSLTSENPVYVQGDFNANSGGNGWSDPEIPTSVAGDAVTLLSDNWSDINSFSSPYSTGARSGNTTWYRMAVIGGNIPSFPQPSGQSQDFGTDGGVHNFLRYIESWNGTLEYQGSIVDLFFSRQANSTFKCCNTVYNPPSRGYNFDVTFLNPAQLPPRTPLFRDVNTTGWTRLLLPGQYQ